jgi:hypothetical protein
MSETAVLSRLSSEVRSFFNELIDGSDKYRQLFSLSEQIPHDYHNRFLVELIQNANDAVPPDGQGTARILLDEQDPRGPRLYVGNEGLPFSQSNFEAICKIGRSDKDPAVAIGNKGLGFRSVLQVCHSPRIYSDYADPSHRSADAFGGFCFEFRPDVRERVCEIAREVIAGEAGQGGDLHPRIYADEPSRSEKLRARLSLEDTLVESEVRFLSPYSLPLAVDGAAPPRAVAELRRAGCVTVVELALNDAAAVAAARAAVGELDLEHLLFTQRLSRLVVEHHRAGAAAKDLSKELIREGIGAGEPLVPPAGLQGLCITGRYANGGGRQRVWWTRSGVLRGDELAVAVRQLPSRWHSVSEIELAVAVERTPDGVPDPGLFSIFLPTEQGTGSALWINGPFHGDLARKHIELDAPYNRLLLDASVGFAIEMLDALLADGTGASLLAALDLVDPREDGGGAQGRLREALARRGTPLQAIPLVPVEAGALGGGERAPLTRLRLIPADGAEALTVARLAGAGAAIPAAWVRSSRTESLRRVATVCGLSLEPSVDELASWAESVAEILLREGADSGTWTAFYAELGSLEKRRQDRDAIHEALRDRSILLSEDGQLVRPSAKRPRIFTLPVQEGVGEAEASARRAIPEEVRPFLAFLSPTVRLYEDRPQRPWTPAARFLRTGNPPLLEGFETREIVNQVLVPITEGDGSVGPDVGLLSATLRYAFELSRASRGDPAHTQVYWSRIRVPTQGGWTRAESAYFGVGWATTGGPALLEALGERHPIARRMLLAPNELARLLGEPGERDEEWEREWVTFLRDVLQVADAPRVVELASRPGAPPAEVKPLEMWGIGYRYYTTGLANHFRIPDALWKGYTSYLAQALNAPVQAKTLYHLQRQAVFEGFFDVVPSAAAAYAVLLAGSFSRWKDALRTQVYRGRVTQTGTADSTLGYVLRHSPWVPAERRGPGGAESALRTPGTVWFIPPETLSVPRVAYRYTFLWHVPMKLAQAMGQELRTFLDVQPLGEVGSLEHGIRLLGALAEAAAAGSVPPERDREFGDLWRDTLEQTARRFSQTEAERVRALAGRFDLTGLRVLEGGRGAWRSEGSLREHPVYVPERGGADPVLAEHVSLADVARGPEEQVLRLLRALFGDGVASLGELLVTPVAPGVDLLARTGAAPTLGATAPWLVRIVLTVLAFGRGQDMNVRSQAFRRGADDLAGVRIVEAPGLELRIGGREDALQAPVAYLWKEQNALLVDPGRLTSLAHLARAFQTLLAVADLEHPLYRVLVELDLTSPNDPEPLDEWVRQALRSLHITEHHMDRIAAALGDQAEMRILPMLHPVVCALRGVKSEEDAREVKRRMEMLASEDSVLGALASALGEPRAGELLALAREAASLGALAAELGSRFSVPLDAWNAAVVALGPPYVPLTNDRLDDDFAATLARLAPLASALLRHAVVNANRRECYLAAREAYDQIEADEGWRSLYWEVPWPLVARKIQGWLERQVAVEPALAAVLTAPDLTEAERSARAVGLDLAHDDEAAETRNRVLVDGLRRGLALRLVVRWDREKGTRAPLPSAFGDFVDAPFYSLEVRSVCQVRPLAEAEARRLVARRAAELRLLDGFDGPVDALSLTEELSEDASARAAERLEGARAAAGKRRSVHRILGAEYAAPHGDLFEGLGEHISSVLPEEFGHRFSLASLSPLGSPPTRDNSGPGPRPRGSRGGVAPKENALVGATGEYLVFLLLCGEEGEDAARVAWVSANRRHFGFPAPGNDALGYDFVLVRDGKRRMIEVKSSGGASGFVDLTANERQVAQRAAARTSGDRYDVVYVANALTDPRVFILGNPYTATGKKRMWIDEGGVRLSFRLSD